MSNNVVGIVASYRKNGTIDQVVSAVLEGTKSKGAETRKIYLIDENIEFCTNCRTCMQAEPGVRRGKCVRNDGMEAILNDLDAASAVVLGAPVNMGSIVAVMKKFVERLAPYSYWPWGESRMPVPRIKKPDKQAVLITSAAIPGFIGKIFMPGALGLLKKAATSLGAEVAGKIFVGQARAQKDWQPPEPILHKARAVGQGLVPG